jgi:hypothetical protein
MTDMGDIDDRILTAEELTADVDARIARKSSDA